MSDDRFKNEERPYIKYHRIKHEQLHPNLSRQAPGTPAMAEVLFQCLKKEDFISPAFTWARKSMRRFSDETIWQMYEEWLQGRVHVELQKNKLW